MSLVHAQALTFTDSAIRYCMLMEIGGGCLTVCLCPPHASVQLCVPSEGISSITTTASFLLCHTGMFYRFNVVLSSTESGDTYQRQVLSIFSIASGICLLGVACMALYRRNKWVMPASQRHISRLCLQKEHFTIMALSPIKVWVCISERMISDFNETWCIWSRSSCKIY